MNSGRTPEDYRAFFASVLADLDARPRRTGVWFAAEDLTIDFADGNPVFAMRGQTPARADYRRRWLPEHPVPLVLSGRRPHAFRLVPTSGNRVKVRRMGRLEAWLRNLFFREAKWKGAGNEP